MVIINCIEIFILIAIFSFTVLFCFCLLFTKHLAKAKLKKKLAEEGSSLEDYKLWKTSKHLYDYDKRIDTFLLNNVFPNLKIENLSPDKRILILSNKNFLATIWIANKFYAYASAINIYDIKSLGLDLVEEKIRQDEKISFVSWIYMFGDFVGSASDIRLSYSTMMKIYKIESALNKENLKFKFFNKQKKFMDIE